MQMLYALLVTTMLLLLSFSLGLRIEDRRVEHAVTSIEIPAPEHLQ